MTIRASFNTAIGIFLLLILNTTNIQAQFYSAYNNFLENTSIYIDPDQPELIPEVYLANLVDYTKHHIHSSPQFKPEMTKLFFSIYLDYKFPQRIFCIKKIDGIWQTPQPADFSGEYHEGGPVFSYEGNCIYYYSNRPVSGDKQRENVIIRFVERINNGWGNSKYLKYNYVDSLIYIPSYFSKDGTFYLTYGVNGKSCKRLIDDLGHQFQRIGKNNMALKKFKLNVELFPKSANVYDSYAESLLVDDTIFSIENYKKSNELNPENNNAFEQLMKINPLQGDYLGQDKPDSIPTLFNPFIPNIINFKQFPVFSADNSWLIFQGTDSQGEGSFFMYQKDGNWSLPERTNFSSGFRDVHFLLSPDESKILFTSNRPINESNEPSKDWNLWYIEKNGLKWSNPKPFVYPVNTQLDEIYGTLTLSNQLYFLKMPKGEWDKTDIYKASFDKGNYLNSNPIEFPVNTDSGEVDPYISPEENFIIICSSRKGSLGDNDLYISFKDNKNAWTEPIHLENKINSSANEVCPWITLDKKYFFFISNRSGEYKAYWVDTSFIKKLNPSIQ